MSKSKHRPHTIIVFNSEKLRIMQPNGSTIWGNRQIAKLEHARTDNAYIARYLNHYRPDWFYFNVYRNGVYSFRVYRNNI